jgi:hypothetical protein
MGDPVKFDPWAMLAELRGLSLLQLQQGAPFYFQRNGRG